MKKRIMFCGEASYLSTGYAIYTRELLSRLHKTDKYEILEFSSYGPAGDPREQYVPWKYITCMPSNDEEKKVYDSNPLNAYGRHKFDEACCNFKPDFVCSPPGELVLTKNGYRPIEEIKIGDEVWTHKNRWKKVLKTFKNQYNGILKYIYYNGVTKPLKLTPNHPILVYKNKKQTNQKKSIDKIYKDEKPIFVSASNVKKGDLITSCAPNNEIIDNIDITKYIKNYIITNNNTIHTTHKNKTKELPVNISLNEELGRLVGYIIGDGCINNLGVSIYFNATELRFVDDVEFLFKKIFNLSLKIHKVKNVECIRVRCNSVLLGEFLTNWIGQAKNKKIPCEFWESSKKTREGLLSGLIRSDGCYKKNTVSICTVKKRLANEYRAICTSINIPTSLQYNKQQGKNGSYDISGYGEYSEKLHCISQKHKSLFRKEKKRNKIPRRVHKLSNYIVSSIKRIRNIKYNGQVYNIEVEDDNSYIINQICVHNCDYRDHWMLSHEETSPLRPYFNWGIMPTCDAIPQEEAWISTYINADAVFAYNDWSLEELRKQGGGLIKTKWSCSPGADLENFKIYPNKEQHKKNLGLDPDSLIIGTVNRNQARKLFPDLIESFKEYLKTAPEDIAKKTLLYLHTCWPDIGWDIPRLLKDAGVSSKVLFTYHCKNCGVAFPSFFQDARTICKNCNAYNTVLPDNHVGVTTQTLGSIINLFDVYVQYSALEGFGMGMPEAAACGVPIMAVDYSAMSDVVRKLNGTPIDVLHMNREAETHRLRTIPNNKDFIQKLIHILSLPTPIRKTMGFRARESVERYYTWDICANHWMKYIDEVLIKNNWNRPPNIHEPVRKIPTNINNEQFIKWGMHNIAGRPELYNSYLALKMIRDLNWGFTTSYHPGSYINESSMMGIVPTKQEFTREKAANIMLDIGLNKNYWEKKRCNLL